MNKIVLENGSMFLKMQERPKGQKLDLRGRFDIDHFREGKFYDHYTIFNDIVNQGKNLLFDVMFNDETQVANSSWYIGLINLTSYSALAATDVMNSHGGWTEFTSYSQSNRVAWGSDAAASQSVTNGTPATFDVSSSGTVKGIFITSNNTKGGTTGYLWSTALFTADVPVVNGDQLKVTYTLNA